MSVLIALQTFGPTRANAQAAAAPAATGLAIESVMLEYQGQAESAARIALALDKAVNGFETSNAYAIVATSADLAALAQLRIVLGQADTIAKRVTQLDARVNDGVSFPCQLPPKTAAAVPAPKPAKTTPPRKGSYQTLEFLGISGFSVPTPADLQTLLQTVASLGAVNMTASPAAGTLTDASLINLVAGRIPRDHVYVPSVYTPTFVNDDFSSSLIYKRLTTLDDDRNQLYKDADIVLNSKTCQSGDGSQNKGVIAELTAEVTATSTVVDTFETSIFSGSATTPVPPAAGGGAAANPPAAAPPATQAPAATTPAAGSSGAPLIALLNADSLQRAINQAKKDGKPVYLVSLHTLESGGNTVTQSNLFNGGQIYYSGGSVATFSISSATGLFVCSGVSYGYRGLIHAKDLANGGLGHFRDPGQRHAPIASNDNPDETLPNVVYFTSSCPAGLPPAPKRRS